MLRASTRLRTATLLVLGLVVVGAAAARAAQDPGMTLAASAGYDGYYKGEFWVPVHVNVSNEGPPVEARVQIGVGSSVTRNQVVYDSPVSLPTRSSKRLILYVFAPSLVDRLSVELLDPDGRVLVEARTNSLNRLELDNLLYGVVTSLPGQLDVLQNVTGGRSKASVAYLQPESLPVIGAALNSLDVVVLHDIDSGTLSPDQREALVTWVEGGGQLVISGGPAWQRTAAAWTDLLPVTISGTVSVDDLPVLASAAGMPFRDPGPYLVTAARPTSGTAILAQDEWPLLATRELGRGQIYFLALDPTLPPLLDWQGSLYLWNEVARRIQALPPWALGAQNSYSATVAVTSLPELALPSTAQLVVFLVLYVAAVGPVNYLVLSRLNRRELAWLTIPALVVLFSGFSYVAGFQLKGNDTIVNQMSLAYGEVGSDRLRVQTILGLYSPRRRVFQMDFAPQTLVRPFERSSGTMSGAGNLDAVEMTDAVSLRNVRVDVSDIQTFVADGYRPALQIEGQAALDLRGANAELTVTVQNNSDVTMETATILLGSNAFALGDIEPGERVSHVGRILQAEALAAAGGGATGLRPVTAPGSSVPPITSNLHLILGSSDYFNDRQLYPRWQFIQALANDYSPTRRVFPGNRVILLAWSDQPQVDVSLAQRDFTPLSTTLYMLEIPFEQFSFSGRGLTVPETMLDWRVVQQQHVFNTSPDSLLLGPSGWVIFEFEPWQEFEALEVSDLAVMLESQIPGSDLPTVSVWNWSDEVWEPVGGPGAGRVSLEQPQKFVGAGNRVRLRLEGGASSPPGLLRVWPILTGDME
jgi:hypothetical protein